VNGAKASAEIGLALNICVDELVVDKAVRAF
jgi:hypothetical protein